MGMYCGISIPAMPARGQIRPTCPRRHIHLCPLCLRSLPKFGTAAKRRGSGRAGRVLRVGLLSLLLVGCGIVILRAEMPEEWVKLGARVHGGFGAFIPVGIRIGEDAMKRLHAQPRELSVVYYSGEGVPCPCSVDGVMLAVSASPGQG